MSINSQKLFAFLLIVIMMTAVLSNIYSDERTKNLQSVTLEDFELNNGKPVRQWAIIPNRFGKEGNVDTGKSLQELSWVQAWPESYFGKEGVFDDGNTKREYKTSLATKISFNRQGYNFVELYPLAEKDGKLVKSPLPFKGIIQQMDMWIWCSNYNYNVYLVLSDYRGVEHRLYVGNLQHIGWKNFTVSMPSYIPQSVSYIPPTKSLSFVKLVIETTPKEKVSGAYVYIDHIKYLSDIFETKYDGYDLADPENVSKLWDEGPKGPNPDDVQP